MYVNAVTAVFTCIQLVCLEPHCVRRTTPHEDLTPGSGSPHDIHVSSTTNDSIAKDHCDRRTTSHKDLTPALPHQSPPNGK